MGETEKPHWFTETKIFKQFLEEYNLTIDDFTCKDCGYSKRCEYAFDVYNIKGDCLGMK